MPGNSISEWPLGILGHTWVNAYESLSALSSSSQGADSSKEKELKLWLETKLEELNYVTVVVCCYMPYSQLRCHC